MTTLRLFLLLLLAAPVCAQQRRAFPPTPYVPGKTVEVVDPASVPQPKLIVLGGLFTQWFSPRMKAASFMLERPVNIYHHVGIQGNIFAPAFMENTYYFFGFPGGSTPRQGLALESGSFEVGVYYKSFFHGRLSGRKSSIYIGPDLRFGWRKYTDDYLFNGVRTPFKGQTVKYLVRLGIQQPIGSALLEVSLPMGIEQENNTRKAISNDPFGTNFQDLNGRRFVMLPSISLGYALGTPKPKPQAKKSQGKKVKSKNRK